MTAAMRKPGRPEFSHQSPARPSRRGMRLPRATGGRPLRRLLEEQLFRAHCLAAHLHVMGKISQGEKNPLIARTIVDGWTGISGAISILFFWDSITIWPAWWLAQQPSGPGTRPDPTAQLDGPVEYGARAAS